MVILFFAGVAASTRVARGVGLEDPGIVVVDEVVGMWTSLLFLPLTPADRGGRRSCCSASSTSSSPIRRASSNRCPGGWGIMADDLMAGIYANLLLRAGRLALGV